jgi:hypothetical protein
MPLPTTTPPILMSARYVPGYSKLTTEEDSEALPELNRIVRDAEAVRDAERANVAYLKVRIISL